MRSRRGFSLVEAVIVLAIVIFFVVIIAASAFVYFQQTKRTEAIINVSAIRCAEIFHKLQTGSYAAAEDIGEINRLLDLDIAGKYYSYRVVNIGTDNFLIIAERISKGAIDSILPATSMSVISDSFGINQNEYLDYVDRGWHKTKKTIKDSAGAAPESGASGEDDLLGSEYEGTIEQATDILNDTGNTEFTYTISDGQRIAGDTVRHYLELIDDRNISIVFSSDPDAPYGSITEGYWTNPAVNKIVINSAIQKMGISTPGVMADTILHEAMHADYDYDPDKWEGRIRAMWPDVASAVDAALARGGPDPLRDPAALWAIYEPGTGMFEVYHPLAYCQVDELFSHINQAEAWERYKDKYGGAPGWGAQAENDNYAYYKNGEAESIAHLGQDTFYGMLPEFYYDPANEKCRR